MLTVRQFNLKLILDHSLISTINDEKLKEMNNVQIDPTTKRAIGYSNSPIKFMGDTNLNVARNNINVGDTFLIVDSNSVSLLCRDLCSKLNIDLSSVKHCTHAVNEDLFAKHKSCLSADVKSSVNETIHLTIDEKKNNSHCAPVHYRKLVKQELDRLAEQKIITKVFKCEWACHTVNVMKPDGNIRICGDYSLTVNKCVKTGTKFWEAM